MIYILEINKIYNEDCLEGIKKIKDNSINLIVLDPPYNINKAKWDKIENYIEWMGKVFIECQRVLKDNGSFYFFHNDFLQIVELQNWLNKNSKFIFKQLITWNKIHENFKNYGYVQQRLSVDMMRNYYNGFTEYCLYYTLQDETGLSYIDKEFVAPKNPFRKELIRARKEAKLSIAQVAEKGYFYGKINHGGSVTNWEKGYNIPSKEQWNLMKTFLPIGKEYESLKQEYKDLRQEYESLRYIFNNTRVKENLRGNSNVWLYPPAKQNGHITPKPTELIENIIEHSSNKDDIILDCFIGSGTTAIASINTNRKFIGFENDITYYNLAKNRINDHIINNNLQDTYSLIA